MNTTTIPLLTCTNCGSNNWSTEKFSGKDVRIETGRITCKRCKVWFRIEHGILDLLPLPLRRDDLYERFSKKNKLTFTPSRKESKTTKGKIPQIVFFKETIDEYEKNVVQSKYYKVLDRVANWRWISENISEKDFVLDLGCGTARQVIPIAKAKARVIGIDIAEEMLMLGREKVKKAGVDPLVDLIVADCENPPVLDNRFTACMMNGTLHHIPHPDKALAAVSRKLKIGSPLTAIDPNRSPIRFLFDLSMMINRLWEEDRDEGMLISEALLKKWTKKAGLSMSVYYSTYLPPHIFYYLNFDNRLKLLKVTDKLFGMIPYINTFGGNIILESKKISD